MALNAIPVCKLLSGIVIPLRYVLQGIDPKCHHLQLRMDKQPSYQTLE